jgi:ribosomal protein L31E
MKRVDCKTRKWTKRAGRGVNEVERFIRQKKDVSECFVGSMYLKEGDNRQVCI